MLHFPKYLILLCAIGFSLVAGCARQTSAPPPEPDLFTIVDSTETAAEPTEPTIEFAPVEPPEKGGGFLGFLRRDKELPAQAEPIIVAEPVDPAEDAPLLETSAAGLEPIVEPTTDGPSLTDEEIAARGQVAEGQPEPSRRVRLFGFLQKRVPGDTGPRDKVEPIVIPGEPSLTDEEIAARSEVAALQPEPLIEDGQTVDTEVLTEPEEKPRRFGLFKRRDSESTNRGRLRKANWSQGGARLGAGAVASAPLGFGELRSACGTKKRELGEEVARSPGSGSYRLYDTAPGSVEPRIQYITGFKDGCPREIMAALVLFGSAQVHETKRYNPRNKEGYSPTDDAYEKAKRKVCRVGKGKRCPAKSYSALQHEVALLTAYPRFGGSGAWMDIVAFGSETTTHLHN